MTRGWYGLIWYQIDDERTVRVRTNSEKRSVWTQLLERKFEFYHIQELNENQSDQSLI